MRNKNIANYIEKRMEKLSIKRGEYYEALESIKFHTIEYNIKKIRRTLLDYKRMVKISTNNSFCYSYYIRREFVYKSLSNLIIEMYNKKLI